VFENIGVVAGMKGVSIGEHPSTLSAFCFAPGFPHERAWLIDVGAQTV